MIWIKQFAILLAFWQAGVFAKIFFHLPIPASVLGLLFLFIALSSGFLSLVHVDKVGQFFLKSMPIFFVPAVASALLYRKEFIEHAGAFLVIVLGSSVLILLSTGLVVHFLVDKKGAFDE